ncbi:MAG TPA: L,D-transpeptidase family protein [Allosphingosinicella sp.]|jgi:lipoprotein-anchoring transpeptidase ErfK/SrfK
MKRLAFLCAAIGLILGSAAPPAEAPQAAPSAPAEPRLTRTIIQAVPGPAELVPPEPAAAAEPPATAPAAAPEAEEPAAPPRRVTAGAVRVLVSIAAQRAWVFRGSELVATTPVSTGKRGHPTPTGTFPILQKRVEHYSNIYDNAPMPYMQRLTHYGIALHGGRVPGYPASHGCIRLPHAFARRLYNLTDHGTRVTIIRARPRSTRHALSLTA